MPTIKTKFKPLKKWLLPGGPRRTAATGADCPATVEKNDEKKQKVQQRENEEKANRSHRGEEKQTPETSKQRGEQHGSTSSCFSFSSCLPKFFHFGNKKKNPPEAKDSSDDVVRANKTIPTEKGEENEERVSMATCVTERDGEVSPLPECVETKPSFQDFFALGGEGHHPGCNNPHGEGDHMRRVSETLDERVEILCCIDPPKNPSSLHQDETGVEDVADEEDFYGESDELMEFWFFQIDESGDIIAGVTQVYGDETCSMVVVLHADDGTTRDATAEEYFTTEEDQERKIEEVLSEDGTSVVPEAESEENQKTNQEEREVLSSQEGFRREILPFQELFLRPARLPFSNMLPSPIETTQAFPVEEEERRGGSDDGNQTAAVVTQSSGDVMEANHHTREEGEVLLLSSSSERHGISIEVPLFNHLSELLAFLRELGSSAVETIRASGVFSAIQTW